MNSQWIIPPRTWINNFREYKWSLQSCWCLYLSSFDSDLDLNIIKTLHHQGDDGRVTDELVLVRSTRVRVAVTLELQVEGEDVGEGQDDVAEEQNT